MTYPTAFTTKAEVFEDPIDNFAWPVTGITNVSGEWRFSFAPEAPLASLNMTTPLVYTYTAANGAIEVIKLLSVNTVSHYLAVTRAQEGTSILPFGEGAIVLQEPTAATYAALKALIQVTQKYGGLVAANNAAKPATCSPGQFVLTAAESQLLVSYVTNQWTALNIYDHSLLTQLGLARVHLLYMNLADLTAWHAGLPGTHITNPTTHKHDGVGGAPIRKFSCGNLASRPAAQHSGDVYFDLDSKALFFSLDGSSWTTYSTLPRGVIMLFEGNACPPGWARATALDDRFPKAPSAGVWTGLGSEGAGNHMHTLSTLVSHTHSVASQAVTATSTGAHTHEVNIYNASGSQLSPYDPGTAGTRGTMASGDAGSHSHDAVFPAANTGSYGTTAPKTDVQTNFPPYRGMIFCRKS